MACRASAIDSSRVDGCRTLASAMRNRFTSFTPEENIPAQVTFGVILSDDRARSLATRWTAILPVGEASDSHFRTCCLHPPQYPLSYRKTPLHGTPNRWVRLNSQAEYRCALSATFCIDSR